MRRVPRSRPTQPQKAPSSQEPAGPQGAPVYEVPCPTPGSLSEAHSDEENVIKN